MFRKHVKPSIYMDISVNFSIKINWRETNRAFFLDAFCTTYVSPVERTQLKKKNLFTLIRSFSFRLRERDAVQLSMGWCLAFSN